MRPLSPSCIVGMQTTRRWHTREAHPQTVADHSAGVALLCLLIDPDLSLEDELLALRLSLLHDAHESVFGDMPFPAKQALAEDGLDFDAMLRRRFWGEKDPYDAATSRVRALVDVADLVEAALFAHRHLPTIAPAVVTQALQAAQKHLSNAGVARVLEILGVRVEVDR